MSTIQGCEIPLVGMNCRGSLWESDVAGFNKSTKKSLKFFSAVSIEMTIHVATNAELWHKFCTQPSRKRCGLYIST